MDRYIPHDDTTADTALDADSISLLRVADGVLTPTSQTVGAAGVFAKGALHQAPKSLEVTPELKLWLTRVLHSTYMTGRASGVAKIFDTDVAQLAQQIARHIPDSYASKFVAMVSKPAGFLSPGQWAFLDAMRAGPPTDEPAMTATEIEAPKDEADQNLSEADQAYNMVARIIAQHPTAKIGLEGMPPGVESRLRAAFPADKFIELTPEMVEAMKEAKRATRN